MEDAEPVKGWFKAEGYEGDRTLEMQLLGLEPLMDEARGATVLDVGCAEGLISIEMAKRGAQTTGFDWRPEYIERAKFLRGAYPCRFEVADANEYQPDGEYSITLALAILHKLKDPSRACARYAKATKDLMVMRLPPLRAPVVSERASRWIPHDLKAVMTFYGFELERVTRGSFAEWTGFFRKRRV